MARLSAGSRDLDERALELELVREPRAALQRVVELRQPDERAAQLAPLKLRACA